jgi:hypothetical protein
MLRFLVLDLLKDNIVVGVNRLKECQSRRQVLILSVFQCGQKYPEDYSAIPG